MRRDTPYLKVKEGERLNISQFPNCGPNPNITGIRERIYGKNALLIKCGAYVYNVPETFYKKAFNL